MKRLAIFLLLLGLFSTFACTKGAAGDKQNNTDIRPAPSSVVQTGENISSNTSPPWPDRLVFFNETLPINVAVGQEFIIRHGRIVSSKIEFQRENIVVLLAQQTDKNPGERLFDFTNCFLFKAIAAGSTNVTITETTRFGDPGPKIIFSVNATYK